jgi:formate C-acetyltransferase
MTSKDSSAFCEKALDNMLSAVRTFFAHGGFQLQINAVSSEMMKRAMSSPEEYRDLIVRVGGFSANFVTLIPQMQQELIDRNEHSIQ